MSHAGPYCQSFWRLFFLLSSLSSSPTLLSPTAARDLNLLDVRGGGLADSQQQLAVTLPPTIRLLRARGDGHCLFHCLLVGATTANNDAETPQHGQLVIFGHWQSMREKHMQMGSILND